MMNWQDFKKSLAEWNKKGLKDYLFPGYVFNKWVFWICFAVIVLGGLVIMFRHDFNFSSNFYYHCPEEMGVCSNPFYEDEFSSLSDVVCPVEDEFFCSTPYFFGGYTYGEPVPSDVRGFPIFTLIVFGIGFIFNHLLFNYWRGKKDGK